ncbi:MAG: aspartyl protease family protein, partial [Bacteroidota bacterium]
VNKSLTMDFIVDTGVQNAILTEKIFGDLLQLNYQRKITIAGPGLIDSVTAFIAGDVVLDLPGGVTASNRSLLVLETDYLQLKNNMGAEIYGIIGYELFSRFIVEINYDQKNLILHDPRLFKKRKFMHEIPLDVFKTKPYIKTTIGYDGQTTLDSIRLMVDTGASHGLLLDPEEDKSIKIPSKTITTNLGKGLGGSIDGQLGRIQEFNFEELTFKDVIASFPDPGIYNKNIKRGARSGTLGGEILGRINPIFDYLNGYIYFYKGKRYNKSFKYDMSGMNISAYGPNLQLAIINSVRKGSPADKAGIKNGDIIRKINGESIENISLTKIFTLLRRKEGYRIKVKIVRNGIELKKCFRLKELI